MLYACDKIYNKYIAVAQRYISTQPPVFFHIVLVSTNINVLFSMTSIIHLLCSAVVEESCLMLSGKKNEIPPDMTHDLMPKIDWDGGTH